MEQFVPPAGTVGEVPAAIAPYVFPTELGAGRFRTTVLTLRSMPLTVRDTEQGGGVKIYTFPKGKLYRMGASGEGIVITTLSALTTLNSGVTGNFGVGSTTQASATLATTEQDIVQVTGFTSSTTAGVAPAAVANAYGVVSDTALDGSSTAIAAFFNVAVAGATDIDANASVSVNGVITINWLVI
jgi:hypothetical protein